MQVGHCKAKIHLKSTRSVNKKSVLLFHCVFLGNYIANMRLSVSVEYVLENKEAVGYSSGLWCGEKYWKNIADF